MGSGSSTTADVDEFVHDESFYLLPFAQRESTRKFEAELAGAAELVAGLRRQFSTAESDDKAGDPDSWLQLSRGLMLQGADRVLIKEPNVSSSSSEEGSETNDDEDDDADADAASDESGSPKRRARRQRQRRGSKSGDSSPPSPHSPSDQNLFAQREAKKERQKHAARERRRSSIAGTAIKIVDCARFAVLRSSEQDGNAWLCLGDVLEFMENKVDAEQQRQHLEGGVNTNSGGGGAVKSRQALTCTINDVSYSAYDCFQRAWKERGVEAAERRMLRIDVLRLLSAARATSAASAAAVAGSSRSAQNSRMSISRDNDGSNVDIFAHMRLQYGEVLEKVVHSLASYRTQPALWFLLSQLLRLAPSSVTATTPPLSPGGGGVAGAAAKGPPGAVFAITGSKKTVTISYESRKKKNSTGRSNAEVVDWFTALTNTVECDPRDMVLWYHVAVVVWPELLSNPFKCVLAAPHRNVMCGEEGLSVDQVIVRALQHHDTEGSDQRLELLVFSGIRGVVNDMKKRDALVSLWGGFGTLVERAVCTSVDCYRSSVSYQALLFELSHVTWQRVLARAPWDAECGIHVHVLAPRFLVSPEAKSQPSDESKRSSAGRTWTDPLRSAALWSIVGSEQLSVVSIDEADAWIRMLERWPTRPLLWRCLGTLLAQRDARSYAQYASRVHADASAQLRATAIHEKRRRVHRRLAEEQRRTTARYTSVVRFAEDENSSLHASPSPSGEISGLPDQRLGQLWRHFRRQQHATQQPLLRSKLSAAARSGTMLWGTMESSPEAGSGAAARGHFKATNPDTDAPRNSHSYEPCRVAIDRVWCTACDCFVTALSLNANDPASWFSLAQLLHRYDVRSDSDPFESGSLHSPSSFSTSSVRDFAGSASPFESRNASLCCGRSVTTNKFGIVDEQYCLRRAFVTGRNLLLVASGTTTTTDEVEGGGGGSEIVEPRPVERSVLYFEYLAMVVACAVKIGEAMRRARRARSSSGSSRHFAPTTEAAASYDAATGGVALPMDRPSALSMTAEVDSCGVAFPFSERELFRFAAEQIRCDEDTVRGFGLLLPPLRGLESSDEAATDPDFLQAHLLLLSLEAPVPATMQLRGSRVTTAPTTTAAADDKEIEQLLQQRASDLQRITGLLFLSRRTPTTSASSMDELQQRQAQSPEWFLSVLAHHVPRILSLVDDLVSKASSLLLASSPVRRAVQASAEETVRSTIEFLTARRHTLSASSPTLLSHVQRSSVNKVLPAVQLWLETHADSRWRQHQQTTTTSSWWVTPLLDRFIAEWLLDLEWVLEGSLSKTSGARMGLVNESRHCQDDGTTEPEDDSDEDADDEDLLSSPSYLTAHEASGGLLLVAMFLLYCGNATCWELCPLSAVTQASSRALWWTEFTKSTPAGYARVQEKLTTIRIFRRLVQRLAESAPVIRTMHVAATYGNRTPAAAQDTVAADPIVDRAAVQLWPAYFVRSVLPLLDVVLFLNDFFHGSAEGAVQRHRHRQTDSPNVIASPSEDRSERSGGDAFSSFIRDLSMESLAVMEERYMPSDASVAALRSIPHLISNEGVLHVLLSETAMSPPAVTKPMLLPFDEEVLLRLVAQHSVAQRAADSVFLLSAAAVGDGVASLFSCGDTNRTTTLQAWVHSSSSAAKTSAASAARFPATGEGSRPSTSPTSVCDPEQRAEPTATRGSTSSLNPPPALAASAPSHGGGQWVKTTQLWNAALEAVRDAARVIADVPPNLRWATDRQLDRDVDGGQFTAQMVVGRLVNLGAALHEPHVAFSRLHALVLVFTAWLLSRGGVGHRVAAQLGLVTEIRSQSNVVVSATSFLQAAAEKMPPSCRAANPLLLRASLEALARFCARGGDCTSHSRVLSLNLHLPRTIENIGDPHHSARTSHPVEQRHDDHVGPEPAVTREGDLLAALSRALPLPFCDTDALMVVERWRLRSLRLVEQSALRDLRDAWSEEVLTSLQQLVAPKIAAAAGAAAQQNSKRSTATVAFVVAEDLVHYRLEGNSGNGSSKQERFFGTETMRREMLQLIAAVWSPCE